MWVVNAAECIHCHCFRFSFYLEYVDSTPLFSFSFRYQHRIQKLKTSIRSKFRNSSNYLFTFVMNKTKSFVTLTSVCAGGKLKFKETTIQQTCCEFRQASRTIKASHPKCTHLWIVLKRAEEFVKLTVSSVCLCFVSVCNFIPSFNIVSYFFF